MKLVKDIIGTFIGGVLEVWQLPQHIVAWILMAVLHPVCSGTSHYHGLEIFYSRIIKSAFTLGKFSFCEPAVTRKGVNHEYGHYRQSMILGPLYLLVIAIPSALHYLWIKLKRLAGIYPEYYTFYTERWAERLKWKD